MNLQILFENDAAVAVSKPVGMASIPEGPADGQCVQAQLSAQLGARLWVVHRLDKEVSGVLLFAKSPEAHRELNIAFEQRRTQKIYRALVVGCVAMDRGEIDAPLREFGSGRMGVDHQRGKPSRTEWNVLERGGQTTLLELRPITGRRHQLRVHCYSMGHPIAGDRRYGDRLAQEKWPRLMLHAVKLTVPLSGQELVAECPCEWRAVD